MRFSYVISTIAGLALAACESPPEVNSSASGDGSSSLSSGQSGSGGPITNAVTSQPVAGQSPGSAEDFVVNVTKDIYASHYINILVVVLGCQT